MDIFELEIWDDEGSECTFYTVKKNDAETNETDKFFCSFDKPENDHKEQAQILLGLILDSIGDKYGALDDFFDRFKNNANALPPKPKRGIEDIEALGINFPLRLYCYRISKGIVVLFNGGIKDALTDQRSKGLSLKFIEAQQYAQRIQNALENNEISISKNGRFLVPNDNSNEIIL